MLLFTPRAREERGVHVASGALFNGEKRLTPQFAAIDSFDLSLERKEIVFSAKRTNSFDVGLVSEDGSEIHWLPDDPADEVGVQWAPRGNKISYLVRTKGGDTVRSVHVPTSFQLSSDFVYGRVGALAWEPRGERYAAAWSSPDASERIETMTYGGESRRVEVEPETRLDVAIEPVAGGLLLRPSSLRYNEKVPLVVWIADDPLEWNDARAALERRARVAVAVVPASPGEPFWQQVGQIPWIDASRLFVVGAPSDRGTAYVADATLPPDTFVRLEPARGAAEYRVSPPRVQSFAAGSIADQLKGTSSPNASQR
jgi:hypothetical protein